MVDLFHSDFKNHIKAIEQLIKVWHVLFVDGAAWCFVIACLGSVCKDLLHLCKCVHVVTHMGFSCCSE